MSTRKDPVGDRFYKPLRRLETARDFLFYVAAILSFTIVLISASHADVLPALQITFLVVALAAFVLGLISALHLAPKAEDERRRDLLTNTHSVPLTENGSVGYFNTDQTNPIRRLASAIAESSFFTREISEKMLPKVRIEAACFVLGWLVLVLVRSVDLSWITVAAQVVFSEQIISKWLRLEWLRDRSDRAFTGVTRLAMNAATFSKPASHAQILECFAEYETAKARASILLSDRIFRRHNSALSAEWERIRGTHNL